MQVKHLIVAAIFFFMPFLSAHGQSPSLPGSAETITLNYPPDGAIMEFDLAGISLAVPKDSADLILVRVNNREEREIVPDSEIECFSVSLEVGVNEILLTAFLKGLPEKEISLSIFRRSELIGKYKDPPDGYKRYSFHGQPRPECLSCHKLEPGEADLKPINRASLSSGPLSEGDMGKTAADSSTCYPCHKAMTDHDHVHGPASVWSCLSCHDPEGEIPYSVEKPDTVVCLKCHSEKKGAWFSKKYIHGPVNVLRCAICHSPHASEYPFNLFMPAWELCVSCHEEKATSRHIVVGYIFEGHPTRGKPDPLREGKEMSCTSCHNPHASDFPNLWALEAKTSYELCQKCHREYFEQFSDRTEQGREDRE